MNEQTFKSIAKEILSSEKKPLHYKEITRFAKERGLLISAGKTPWATMNAQLSMDIVENGENSLFYRAQPGYFGLRSQGVKRTSKLKKNLKYVVAKHKVTDSLNSKQKGDIAEARVAELLTLYGDEGLTCYRPISDDEGIDIIVKRRSKLDVTYLQVKSTFGYKERGFLSSVKDRTIINKERMILIFVYFDLSIGDLYEQIFCIPAPDFLKLTSNENKKPGERVFTVGLRNPDKSKYSEFMIEKRELANRIVDIMDKL